MHSRRIVPVSLRHWVTWQSNRFNALMRFKKHKPSNFDSNTQISLTHTRSPKLRRRIIKYTYHKYFSNIYSSIKTHDNKKLNKRKLINFSHWHWKRKIKKERNWEFFLSFSDKSSRKWIHIAHSIRNTKKGLYFWHTQ